MKYIDARNMESLNQGVMKVLNITKGDMIQMFDSIYSDTEKEPWKWVEDFLSDYRIYTNVPFVTKTRWHRHSCKSELETIIIGELAIIYVLPQI